LQVRGNLSGLVLIVDIRRGLGPLDKSLIAWVQPNVPILVLLSKADKLGQQERMKALAALRVQPELANRQIFTILFSVLTNIGIEDTRAFINYFMNPLGPPPPEPDGSRRKAQDPNTKTTDKKNPSDHSARVERLNQAPAQGGEAGPDP
jgi:hypothetical protein